MFHWILPIPSVHRCVSRSVVVVVVVIVVVVVVVAVVVVAVGVVVAEDSFTGSECDRFSA